MFTGAMTALITPFRNGEVDEDALRALVEEQLAAGVHGLVPVATTGESATLTHEEHERVVRIVVKQVNKRVPVIAGTGSNNTREAVELTAAAKRDGADGALLIAPYYNKPTQEGLYRHFAKVADEVALPQIVYNIPGRTAVTIAPETLVRLSAHPHIVGVKDATGSWDNASKVMAKIGEKIAFYAGDDSMTLPLIAIGGKGVISAVANIVPGDMVKYTEAALKGDMETARALHWKLTPIIEAAFIETNPIPAKTALGMMGKCSDEVRLPLCEMTADNREKLRRALVDYGLVKESAA